MQGYAHNVFTTLLQRHFGGDVADDLIRRFEIGTSAHWPGATVFWQRDAQGRMRGGQVVLFDEDGHTAKKVGADGVTRRCTTWVHTSLAHVYDRSGKPRPEWLQAYLDPAHEVKRSPSLYGMGQLTALSPGSPVAIVEAPKTAVLCTPYFPQFTWLAVGALDYLNAERLHPLKEYPITLYPDASEHGRAYAKWCAKADELRSMGFRIAVSDILEKQATPSQKKVGIDLADVLLENWAGYPLNWDADSL
nr:DUF6371 domain-containing protein [Hymenobacter fodinae]